jgi:Ca-activated chloride channel homolog
MRDLWMRLFMVILLLPFLGFTFLDPVAKKNEEGNDLFDKGEYDAALKRYLEAQQNAPSRSELRFNVGDALYKQGKYKEAAQELGRVVESENQSLGAGAYYNLGNTFFRQEKYQEAVGAYKKSLMLNPQDQDAKVNLELALEKMQQNQENKQDQNKDNKDQDKQDQDKQDQDEQDQDKQDQDKQDQDKQDQDKQDQDKQDQDKQDQDKQDQDKQDQNKDNQQNQQNQQDQKNQEQQDQNADGQNPQEAQGQPGELTQEEAARILDAMKDRDEASQKRRKVKVSGRRYNGNAW